MSEKTIPRYEEGDGLDDEGVSICGCKYGEACPVCEHLPVKGGVIRHSVVSDSYSYPNPDGAWVKYEDVAPLLKERDALRWQLSSENAKLSATLAELAKEKAKNHA